MFFIPGVQPIVFGKMRLAFCSLNSNSMEMVGAKIRAYHRAQQSSFFQFTYLHPQSPESMEVIIVLYSEHCGEKLYCKLTVVNEHLLNSVISDQTMPVITIKDCNYN